MTPISKSGGILSPTIKWDYGGGYKGSKKMIDY